MPDNTVVPTMDDMTGGSGSAKTAVPKIGEIIATLGGTMSSDVKTIVPALEELGDAMSGYDPTPPVEIDALEVTENGTYEAEDGHAYSPVTVSVSGGGGGTGGDPIRFFDYDGTLVASYAEVPDSLPEVPTHNKLTNGTWNYTLAQIGQQLNAVGTCDVGANYETVSGGTEIDFELVDPNRLSPYLQLAVSGRVAVDWGDGSAVSTMVGSSLNSSTSRQHVYPDVGAYTITITPDYDEVQYAMFSSSASRTLLNASASQEYSNMVYGGLVKAVRLGRSCEIGSSAFTCCRALTSVSIPDGMTTIGAGAFTYCDSLTYVTIPSSVTSLGNGVFNGCYLLDSISIPSGVTAIGTNEFNYCRSLKSVSIPYGVTSIPSSALNSCSLLTSVALPDGVTSIESNAFYYCYSLKSVNIPSSVTSLGSSAFCGCYLLSSVDLPSGVTAIDSNTFYGCHSLKSVNIPDGVTSIGSGAFRSCPGIKSITIPDGVTSIGINAFQECSLLSSVDIPSSVTTIGNNAFNTCGSLVSVTIPSSVTSIGSSAFASCGGLAEVHFEGDTPPTLSNSNAFSSLSSDCKFYVPYSEDHSVLDAYKTATNWSAYASRMIEEDA